jgi:zinc and cadmium transporter
MLGLIIVFTLIGSVLSLVSSFFLLLRRDLTEALSGNILNFAAGALLGVAFLDLLPHASEHVAELEDEVNIFMPALGGFLLFFFLERFLSSFHYHHEHGARPTNILILAGDSVHNFIDGLAITAAFLSSTSLGISTSLAVAAHEVPQEIADMGVLLANGWSRTRALLFNFLSALTALAGALLAFAFSSFVEEYEVYFLAAAAGLFVYIAASDLIPQIHERFRQDQRFYQVGFFLLGIIAIYIFTLLFESEAG